MNHTAGLLGEVPWGCAHPRLLTGLSQMPAAQTSIAATRAPDQSHCGSSKEQLEPEPLGVAQLAKRTQVPASPVGLPGSPPMHVEFSLLWRLRVCAGAGVDKAMYF